MEDTIQSLYPRKPCVSLLSTPLLKSLEGNYRPENLFAFRQSLAAFHYYQQLVVEADQEIQRQLGTRETATTAEPTVPNEPTRRHIRDADNEPKMFDLRSEAPAW